MEFLIALASIILATGYVLISGICAHFIVDDFDEDGKIAILKIIEIVIIAYLIYSKIAI